VSDDILDRIRRLHWCGIYTRQSRGPKDDYSSCQAQFEACLAFVSSRFDDGLLEHIRHWKVQRVVRVNALVGARDALDPELAEFAQDAGAAPGVLFRQTQHQLTDFIRRPGPAGLPFGRRLLRGVSSLGLTNPTQERLVGDNRDQFLQLLPELLAEPEQPPFLLIGRARRIRFSSLR
jgi:hypothetical protein